MLYFGLLSSIFDYATFGVLLLVLRADPVFFRTGWFVESVLSASFVVLVIRTRRPFFQSRPSPYLALATVLVAAVVVVLPYTGPLAAIFGLRPLPAFFWLSMVGILLAYGVVAEGLKRRFYRPAKAEEMLPSLRPIG
jgi:Mg2+-importing ATPase